MKMRSELSVNMLVSKSVISIFIKILIFEKKLDRDYLIYLQCKLEKIIYKIFYIFHFLNFIILYKTHSILIKN